MNAHGAGAKAAATQPASRGAQHESGSERRAALTHSRTRQSKNKSVLYFRQPKLERSPTARRCRLQAGARERHMKGGRSRGLSGPPWPPGTGPSTSSFCASRLRASAAAAQCQRHGSLLALGFAQGAGGRCAGQPLARAGRAGAPHGAPHIHPRSEHRHRMLARREHARRPPSHNLPLH